MKRPAFQFYPADWRKHTDLQTCSIGARGLWVEMLCIMHECEPYGHLTLRGDPMPVEKLARLAGLLPAECELLLKELEDADIFSRTRSHLIYSRRMVKDEAARAARAAGGPAGAVHGKKGGRPARQKPLAAGDKGFQETPSDGAWKPLPMGKQNPLDNPPSSSSSVTESNTDRSSIPSARAVEDASGLVGWLLETLNDPNLVRQPLAQIAREWRGTGLDDEAIRVCIGDVLAQRRAADPNWMPGSLRYFTPGIKQRAEVRSGDGASAMPSDPDDDRVQRFKATGFWMAEWDEFKPNDPRCSVSPTILRKHGYRS
jgi:hypothetical protein